MAGPNGVIGNSTEDMADLVAKISAAVTQIQDASHRLDSKVGDVKWYGPDADRFKHSEWPTHRSQLQKVCTDLEHVKSTVNKQKDEQTHASA